MKISVVSDEVSADPETAFEIIRSWGVDYVELRSIGEERVPFISDYWKVRIPQLLKEYGLKVAALSPGSFQTPFPAATTLPVNFSRKGDITGVRTQLDRRGALQRDLEVTLPQSFEMARELGAEAIITFAFSRMDHLPSPFASDEMIEVMQRAAELAAAAKMRLLVEVSEPSDRPADMVRRVNHKALGINWDPVAAFLGGEDRPYPDGFALLRPYIGHVHFKDGRKNPATGEREMGLDGVIDWRGGLRDLAADGFDGFISVETHFRPKVAGTKACLDRLKALVDDVRSTLRVG